MICACPTPGTKRTSISGDFDVIGVTLPGMPYVIVGHNRYIAWGFTNLGPAVEDVFIEKFNDKGEYLTPQGWVQPEHRKEIIRVKGKPEVNVDVVVTRHGPIITSLVPGETRQLALQWIIYKPNVSRIPFFQVNSAKNWDEFRAAFSTFGAPGQNVVYADVDGHIGYQATGFVPIRAAGDGSLPVPGDTDAYEWTGFIPYDQMPRVFDPPSGIIATANGRITPDGYPYSMSIEWDAPYRTERIYKLLGRPMKFSPADMLAIETDVVSELDRFCAERFVYAIDHTPKASERAKVAADLMRNWDGAMSTDSPAPTIAYVSRGKLNELILKPKLGDEWIAVLAMVHEHGVAGERALATAVAMAALRLRQLRRVAHRGGRSRYRRSQDAELAQPLDLGPLPPDRRQASVLEQLPHPQARRRAGTAAAVGRWRNGQAGRHSLRSIRTLHCRHVRPRQLHAQHREWRIRESLR